jgi:transposase
MRPAERLCDGNSLAGKCWPFFGNIPRCVVGLEACGGSHYWAHELARLGHDARMIPPRYVRAYVKTNKHDAADAEACCEAVQRPGMRFVPVKSEQQQSMLMIHRARVFRSANEQQRSMHFADTLPSSELSPRKEPRKPTI